MINVCCMLYSLGTRARSKDSSEPAPALGTPRIRWPRMYSNWPSRKCPQSLGSSPAPRNMMNWWWTDGKTQVQYPLVMSTVCEREALAQSKSWIFTLIAWMKMVDLSIVFLYVETRPGNFMTFQNHPRAAMNFWGTGTNSDLSRRDFGGVSLQVEQMRSVPGQPTCLIIHFA